MNLALDRAMMLECVEKSRSEAALAFMERPRVKRAVKPPLSGNDYESPWIGSINKSNPCSPKQSDSCSSSSWSPMRRATSTIFSQSDFSPVTLDPCSPPSSRIGMSTPKRLSVNFAESSPVVHAFNDPTSPFSPLSTVKRAQPSRSSTRSAWASPKSGRSMMEMEMELKIEVETLKEDVPPLPMSPVSPLSASSDDSEPPISKSQPLGRRPMGLVNTGKAAVLPALPPQIFAKMKSKKPGNIQRVSTWPPATRSGAASVLSFASQPAMDSPQPEADLKPDPGLNPQQNFEHTSDPNLKSKSTADVEPEEQGTAQAAVPLALQRLREAQQRRRQNAIAAAAR